MSVANPFDGSAAMVVPQNVEKIPLYHWHPGSRVLCVGSRDGASFSGAVAADEAQTYRRQLSPQLLAAAAAAAGLDCWCASWTASLHYPQGLASLFASGLSRSLIATPASGDPEVLAQALDYGIDAWLVLLADDGREQPLAAEILARGKHVEVLWGLSSAQPQLDARWPWERVSAIHLQPQRPALAVGPLLQAWEDAARRALPPGIAIYDFRSQVTTCPHCGTDLVWRHAGRARLGALAAGESRCSACGGEVPVVV